MRGPNDLGLPKDAFKRKAQAALDFCNHMYEIMDGIEIEMDYMRSAVKTAMKLEKEHPNRSLTLP